MTLFDVMYNCRAMRKLDSREVPEDMLVKFVDGRRHLPVVELRQAA